MVTAALGLWLWTDAKRLDQTRFDQETQSLVEHLDTRTEKVEGMLHGLQRTLSARKEPSLVDWEEYMNQVAPQWNLPGVLAVGYATNLALGQALNAMDPWLRERERRDRREFFLMPKELPLDRQWQGWLMDVYKVGLEPRWNARLRDRHNNHEGKSIFTRYQNFHGKPMLQETGHFGRRDGHVFDTVENPSAVWDAVTRDEAKITPRQMLLRDTNGQPVDAVMMTVPVAHPARREAMLILNPSTDPIYVAETWWLRWQMNAGLVFAYLDYAAILADIRGATSPEIDVEIFCNASAGSEISEPNWLNPHPGGMRATRGRGLASFERLQNWAMYGTKWQLFFYTTPQFDRVSTKYRGAWAGALGLVATGLICALLTVQIRGRLVEKQRAAELRDARDALQAAQRQRERLSHDLHDGAIQSIYAIQLVLTGVEKEVKSANPRTAQRLIEGRAGLDVVIGELRGFIAEMKEEQRPLPAASLAGVLQSLVQRLRTASPAKIDLECDPTVSPGLTSHQTVQLAAIAREALSNSLRHARATRITVRLSGAPDKAALSVTDDGAGFEFEKARGQGMGLDSMRRRAAELHGELSIETKFGQGTRVSCTIAANSASGNGSLSTAASTNEK